MTELPSSVTLELFRFNQFFGFIVINTNDQLPCFAHCRRRHRRLPVAAATAAATGEEARLSKPNMTAKLQYKPVRMNFFAIAKPPFEFSAAALAAGFIKTMLPPVKGLIWRCCGY